MKKQKLNLNDLEVKSFVTSINPTVINNLKGGWEMGTVESGCNQNTQNDCNGGSGGGTEPPNTFECVDDNHTMGLLGGCHTGDFGGCNSENWC